MKLVPLAFGVPPLPDFCGVIFMCFSGESRYPRSPLVPAFARKAKHWCRVHMGGVT
jgi:hypothetical protein